MLPHLFLLPVVVISVVVIVVFVAAAVALNISTLCGNHVNFTFAMFVVVYFACCSRSSCCCCNGQFLPASVVKIHQAMTAAQGARAERGVLSQQFAVSPLPPATALPRISVAKNTQINKNIKYRTGAV